MKKLLIVCLCLMLIACCAGAEKASDPVRITLADDATACDADTVTVTGNVITVTAAGEYELTGTLTAGTVIVDVSGEEDVRLYLNGVDITCPDGPAILVRSCGGRVSLYTMYGAENRLTAEASETGAVYAVSDVTVTGTGSLTVACGDRDGIKSDKGLRVKGGILQVNAGRHGLSGKKKVEIMDGEITIRAGKDGVKSNGSKETKGHIEITGGSLDITAGDSPISYTHTLTITGGSIHTAKTGEQGKGE